MAVNELAQRFNQAWGKLTTGEQGTVIPAVDGAKFQHSGVVTGENGVDERASVVTHEIPYVAGSLRPHMRMIEVSLSGDKTVFASDATIHVFPNSHDNAHALDVIERFRTT